MLVWDTTELKEYAAKVATKTDQINEAINWEELSFVKKITLKKKLKIAKERLSYAIECINRLPQHWGSSLDYYDKLIRDEEERFLNLVRHLFPYQKNMNKKIADIIYDREWHRKSTIHGAIIEEKMWLERELKDKRYKCCRNNHCYKNTEHTCRWCGNGEVMDRVDENMPIHNRIFYVGIRDGKWVLSTNPDIESKSEQIRKITIDMVGKYKHYYHLDGKNPNPFYNNDINIGNQNIKGGYLVQLCDKLLDGGLNEILI